MTILYCAYVARGKTYGPTSTRMNIYAGCEKVGMKPRTFARAESHQQTLLEGLRSSC